MKKTITILLAAVLCLALFSACSVTVSVDYGDSDKYTAGGATLEAELTGVDIGWISGEVNIAYHEENTVEFSETANMELDEKDTLHYWLDGTVLHINFAKSGYINISDLQKTLTLYLPKDTELGNLDVDSVSGDVNIDGIQTLETDVSTVSGRVKASGIAASDELSFETVSGDVEATLGESLRHLEVETVSGNADISVASLNEYSFGTTSGDMRLTCGGVPAIGSLDAVSGSMILIIPETAGFTAKVDTVSGEFRSDIPVKLDGKKFICGDGTAQYDLETVSGDIDIRINEAAVPAA